MKLWFNLLCGDIEAQMRFYQALLGWPEAVQSRSPIYRALERDGVQFGLNAQAAYALLNLESRRPRDPLEPAAVTAFATFMLDAPSAVTEAVKHVAALGGGIVKPPYATYYGQWQAVLCDPEQHVFRLSAVGLPPDEVPPARPA